MPSNNGNKLVDTPMFTISSIVALPHELLQSLFGLVANFEPWTYNHPADGADASITDDDLLLYRLVAQPLSFASVHRNVIGLSGEYEWVLQVLSRHPYHLSRSGIGISAIVSQALRRMNAQH